MKKVSLLLITAGVSLAIAMTGTKAGAVEQNSRHADGLRNVLQKISMPEGFKIELLALAPGARHMAVDPITGTLWIGTRRDTVWVARDKTVEEFSPGIDFDIPNGVCLAPDGVLYVVERNRVLAFATAARNQPVVLVARGDLIPGREESRGHTARVCAIGPDDRLYISLGQPYNVSPPGKQALYNKTGIGGIIRLDRDGGNREVVATGIRNSVGHAFNPQDGSLWFTDNQVDGMGDETPPGELNRMPRPGMWFGFPYYGGGQVRTDEYKGRRIPEDLAARYVKPQVEMIAHAADLGMMFYTGTMFPKKYQGAIFSAQHGSWDASPPRGARVMVTFLDNDGNAAASVPFAEGWKTPSGDYLGRPVDVQQYIDGSILVSDDKAGAIYRISYQP